MITVRDIKGDNLRRAVNQTCDTRDGLPFGYDLEGAKSHRLMDYCRPCVPGYRLVIWTVGFFMSANLARNYFFSKTTKKSLDSAFWQKKFRLGRVTVNGDIFFLRLSAIFFFLVVVFR